MTLEKMNVIDGINVPPFETPQRREDIRTKFKIRPDDVLLATFPKSGTTWTQNIMRYFLLPDTVDSEKDLDAIIPWIDLPWPPVEEIEAMPSPRCIKSHCPAIWLDDIFKGSKTNKIIFCYRNPKDVAVSLYISLKSTLSQTLQLTVVGQNILRVGWT